MSWCRFSTICENNISSDIYVYEDVIGGVTIHIAERKRKYEEFAPRMPNFQEVTPAEWIMANHRRSDWLEYNAPFYDINLPYAGETFNFNNKDDLIEKLDELRELGYNFPERVFDFAKEWEPEL